MKAPPNYVKDFTAKEALEWKDALVSAQESLAALQAMWPRKHPWAMGVLRAQDIIDREVINTEAKK